MLSAETPEPEEIIQVDAQPGVNPGSIKINLGQGINRRLDLLTQTDNGWSV